MRAFALIAFLLLSRSAHADSIDTGMREYSRGNYELAAKLLEPLAQQGNEDAQYLLGYIYSTSFNTHDDSKAIMWLTKAAEKGKPEAQYFLGWVYYKGWGVKKDDKQAAVWFAKVRGRWRGHALDKIARICERRGEVLASWKASFIAWLEKPPGDRYFDESDFPKPRHDATSLNYKSAVEDADWALRNRDLRLLSVMGVAEEVPGVKDSLSALITEHGVRLIEGTGDAMASPEDQLFNENARKYAEEYNKRILEMSGSQP